MATSLTPYLEQRVPPKDSRSAFLRPQARGKFLFVGGEKFFVRGVTYGTFRPGPQGEDFWRHEQVEQDFGQIVANGFNAIRTYTPPPAWMLDLALRHALRVMVGLPWEQHINFLDDPGCVRSIKDKVKGMVARNRSHPAVMGYAVGNEIPSAVVRWHGRRAVERFLEGLFDIVRAEDPGALVTYVNYPSTEYLTLPSADLVCFNVFLESQDAFQAYLARLHNLSDDRPLLLTEMGLDSRRNGLAKQARTLDWQVRTAMSSGCAGSFVFAWTDEWHRGGNDVEDWDFGLTTRDRRPKPALHSARRAFAKVPFPDQLISPSVSVIVCTHNGARTIRPCLESLFRLEYGAYEVIIVDDGSTDSTSSIAAEFGFRLIKTDNRGLSSARNTGLAAARGEIVAYTDDDAYPDPHWLNYLVATFVNSSHAAVGGPNIPPPNDGLVADCVANAPGGPVHVLLSDQIAEHIPGCNMAFWRQRLLELGGFDPQFRVAGDDVDICWRIQKRGWTIGFSPAAMVWHHRRNTIDGYLKQQRGYGRAEALLERKWPENYNVVGHVTWSGRVYGRGFSELFGRSRIYYGIWGGASFQSLYQSTPATLLAAPHLPEWWFLVVVLSGVMALGTLWAPLLWLWPLIVLALGTLIAESILNAMKTSRAEPPCGRVNRLVRLALTSTLHFLQPLARLIGRLRSGLTVWRYRGHRGFSVPRSENISIRRKQWLSPEKNLHSFELLLRRSNCFVIRGGAFDRWDLEVRGGLFGAARFFLLTEEHGNGIQFLRMKIWPTFRLSLLVLLLVFVLLAVSAGADQSWLVSIILGGIGIALVLRTLWECSRAQAALKDGVARWGETAPEVGNGSGRRNGNWIPDATGTSLPRSEREPQLDFAGANGVSCRSPAATGMETEAELQPVELAGAPENA